MSKVEQRIQEQRRVYWLLKVGIILAFLVSGLIIGYYKFVLMTFG